MTLPDRELTPTELRQLCESNSRAIMALSDSVTEGFRETRQAIDETNRNIDRLENNVSATSEAVFQLASLMQRFFQNQIDTNTQVEGRLNRLDPQN